MENQDSFGMEQNGLQLTQEFLSNQVTFGVDGEVCDKSIFQLFDINGDGDGALSPPKFVSSELYTLKKQSKFRLSSKLLDTKALVQVGHSLRLAKVATTCMTAIRTNLSMLTKTAKGLPLIFLLK